MIKHNPRVIVLATSRKTHGGITSVVRAHQLGRYWNKYHCRWIETTRDGNNIRKILYLIRALFLFIVYMPFSDMVHIHFSVSLSAKRKYIFFIIARLLRKKIIIHLHCGNQLNTIWNWIYKDMFIHSDLSIVLSNNIKEQIEQHIGYSYKIKVLYNPCISQYSHKYEKQKYILYAGVLDENKGYTDLLKGFAMISDKHPDWKLVFAGNGQLELAKKLSHDLGIENSVILLGWVLDKVKDRVFQEASIFCLPSYAEGFPMAILDAWSYGLPVIATPVGGIPDVIVDRHNGLLFQPGDINMLSQQLDLMISDSTLRNRISNESLALSRTEFNIENITSQLDQIYEQVLNS
jgi:glycosyltransferase involved in cell wall biosynthesis